jgi:hypothetical protein
MKKLMLVLMTLLMTSTYADEYCNSIDLNETANIVMGTEQSEDDSFFGYFMESITLMGCILDAESMDDLNMSVLTLVKYKNYMEESFKTEFKELENTRKIIMGTLQIESDPVKRDDLKKELIKINEAWAQTESDYNFLMGKIEDLISSN